MKREPIDPQDVVESHIGPVVLRALVMCLVNGDMMDVVYLDDTVEGPTHATVLQAEWTRCPGRVTVTEVMRDKLTAEHLDMLCGAYASSRDDRLAEAFWDTFESASASLVVAYRVPAVMASYRARTAPVGQPRPARRRLRRAPWLLCTTVAAVALGVAGCQGSPPGPGLVDFTAACDQNHNAYRVRPDTIEARAKAQEECHNYTGEHLGPGVHYFGLMPSVDPS